VTPQKTPEPRKRSRDPPKFRPVTPVPFEASQAWASAVWSHAKAQAKAVRAAEQTAPVPLAAVPGEQPKALSESSQDGDCGAFISTPLSQANSQASQMSQSTQSQPDEHVSSSMLAATFAALSDARAAFAEEVSRIESRGGAVAPEVPALAQSMVRSAVAYWSEVSVDLGKAAQSLTRFCTQWRRLYWQRPNWRGVNLGGWLLLEPGTCSELFQRFAPRGSSEWHLVDAMRKELGDESALREMEAHRETFITEQDIKRIRELGLNAVRIPFGYWIIAGPSKGDPYLGPGLQHLDNAVAWCKKHGLQVLLDLHGVPGGENGGPPCGRENPAWHWQEWRFEESLDIIKTIARRYRGAAAVAGISVCNEPSEKVPAQDLCRYYDRAISTIREAGMSPDNVVIALSIYRTERVNEIWRVWSRDFEGFARHANVAFDLHVYHCFGPWWAKHDLAGHLKMTRQHRKILRRVPAIVGEWSLDMPDGAFAGKGLDGGKLTTCEGHWCHVLGGAASVGRAWYGASNGDCGLDVTSKVRELLPSDLNSCVQATNDSFGDPAPGVEKVLYIYLKDEASRRFGRAQLDSYNHASHGWFFWNWKDHNPVWDFQKCMERQWMAPADVAAPVPKSTESAAKENTKPMSDLQPKRLRL